MSSLAALSSTKAAGGVFGLSGAAIGGVIGTTVAVVIVGSGIAG